MPGPTILATEGETIRVVVKNKLPMTDKKGDMPPGPKPTGTAVHFHGLHQPNDQDGVAGISQPDPIMPGEVYTYEITPEHAGTYIEFVADNPGNWIFHCHVPHHTSNAMLSGYNGGPVGMTRIFNYKGYEPVRKEYFDYSGS